MGEAGRMGKRGLKWGAQSLDVCVERRLSNKQGEEKKRKKSSSHHQGFNTHPRERRGGPEKKGGSEAKF